MTGQARIASGRSGMGKRAIRLPSPGPRSFAFLAWLLVGLAEAVFCMRFAMRALGVREDIPFPGAVYSLTSAFVSPFYRFFPVSPRFDYRAVEVASLAAAGTVLLLALAAYLLTLLISEIRRRRNT